MFDRLFDFLKTFWRALMFFDIMDPYAGGVVLRLGKFHRMAKVGWNWLWPLFIERIIWVNVATHTVVVGPQSLTTKDGKPIVIETVLTCTIEDPKVFILEIDGGIQAIDDAAPGVVSSLVMGKTWEELQTMDVNNELTKAVRRMAKAWGVSVTRMQVASMSTMRSIRLLQSMSHAYPERRTEF